MYYILALLELGKRTGLVAEIFKVDNSRSEQDVGKENALFFFQVRANTLKKCGFYRCTTLNK